MIGASFCDRESWSGQFGGICADFLCLGCVDIRTERVQWRVHPFPRYRRRLGETRWYGGGALDARKPKPGKWSITITAFYWEVLCFVVLAKKKIYNCSHSSLLGRIYIIKKIMLL